VVREPVALTVAAQLTTLPVILLNFERLSLVAPLANVVVVPLVPLVMLCSALAAAAGALPPDAIPVVGDALRWATGGAAWLYLRLMIAAGQAAAAVPMAAVDLAAPAWLAGVWYPALALFGRRSWGGSDDGTIQDAAIDSMLVRLARPRRVLLATAGVVVAVTIATRPDGRLHLFALDVGQGDALLVVAPSGAVAMIDGGPDPDLAMRRLGEVLPFWQRRIDLLVLTHPHEDHIAGLLPALERYQVRTVLEAGIAHDNPSYPRFRRLAAAEPGALVRLARAGAVLELDPDTRLTVLYPSESDATAPLPEGDINNASVVLLLEHGGFRALLTGDAEAPVEHALLARGLIGPVDVLKVGHHGSDSSSTPDLLAAARPRIALISAGVGNEYGHPHAVTLEHLAGVEVRRTDVEGTLELVVEPSGPRVKARGAGDAGSIGPWPFPPASRRNASWPRPACRRGSSPIRVASPAWRARRRGWWPPAGYRSTGRWSRSPPSSTTSTSWRRGPAPASMAWWAGSGWSSSAGRSWRCRSPRTRSPPCWTPTAIRRAGSRSSCQWPTATWRRGS
ncbi:MAG TPA: MBL fold metallo-hydrolase, partial [candidate division Zixibacteria bacterium]|nr:MBL fold metallo-hydrolase [candidate division Zixibacteria bacterium]